MMFTVSVTHTSASALSVFNVLKFIGIIFGTALNKCLLLCADTKNIFHLGLKEFIVCPVHL